MIHLRQKGAALIVTLWALALLAVVAASFSFATRFGSAGARNFKEDAKAYYLAVSAYEEAMAWLLNDADMAIDYTNEEGVLYLDEEHDPLEEKREKDGATIELKITDESARLNINTVNLTLLKNLFVHAGIPDDAHQELSDSLLDWLDPDDLHHFSGAEDGYYEEFGYKAKNHTLNTPEELALVKGFKKEYLYGSEDADSDSVALLDLITTWGDGLNINTISPDMMEALGMDPLEVDSLMTMRRNGMIARSVPNSLRPVRGKTMSSYFRIISTARLENNPAAIKLTAVVKRSFGAYGPELQTLYWKEEIDYSGTEHTGT